MRPWRAIAVVTSIVVTGAGLAVTTTADATTGTGGSYVAVTPQRIADTSDDASGFSSNGHFGGGETKTVQVTNRAGVPTLANVSAVVVDVAAASSRDTRVYVDPSDETRRLASLSINGASADGWDSTTVIVRPGPDGKIKVFNEAGATRMNIDVQGYFTKSSTSASTGGYIPTAPTRVIDSSNDKGYTEKVQGGSTKTARLAGVDGIPANATGVFAHVRVLNATGPGGVRFARGDQAVGHSTPSLVNYEDGRPYDGSGIIPVDSNGNAKLWASDGTSLDIVIDVHGYFTRGTDGGSFHPVTKDRIYDSSNSTNGDLAPGETRVVKVGGRVGIPDTKALGAVAMSITALDWTSSGYVSVVDADLPDDNGTSNLRFTGSYASTETALTSSAIVEMSSTNTVKIRNRSGSPVRILLNAEGWFDASADRQARMALREAAIRITSGTGTPADYSAVKDAGIADEVPDGAQAIEVEGIDEDDMTGSEPDAEAISGEETTAPEEPTTCPAGSTDCAAIEVTEDEPASETTSPTTETSQSSSAGYSTASAEVKSCASGHRARRLTGTAHQKSVARNTIFRWYHRIQYCTKSGKVTKVRARTKGFGAGTDSGVYDRGLIETWYGGVGSTKVTSYMKTQLEYCVTRLGCYGSARPSVKLWVTGSGGKKVKAKTNGD